MTPRDMKADVNGRHETERRHGLLAAELNHRLRNALAQMRVIVESSRREAQSADALADAILGRIDALSRAHARFSQSHSTGVWLSELVEGELAPYRTDTNVSVEGPDLPLIPEPAQALTMVLHELVTNAVKHGALSAATGRVSVGWQVVGELSSALLNLVWEERGGPIVISSMRRGFGTRLIDNLVRHELGGRVELSLLPRGVHCEIEVPLARVAGAAESL
jgi:two-component system, chemotaxis family, sensor kinase Cph1